MTTTRRSVSFEIAGVNALQVRFSAGLDAELPTYLNGFRDHLLSHFGNIIVQAIPAYTTLLIEYDPRQSPVYQLQQLIERELESFALQHTQQQRRLVDIPVTYGGEYGEDLNAVARACQLSVDEVIKAHCSVTYSVCALGFAPGFAYLSGLPEALHLPRLDTPRQKVKAGTLAIAGQQTAVYPADSPGGWHLIGYSPVQWFRADKEVTTPVHVGDHVRFIPVNSNEMDAWCKKHSIPCREGVL